MKNESLEWEMQEVADGAPLTTLVRLPAGPPGRAFLGARLPYPLGVQRAGRSLPASSGHPGRPAATGELARDAFELAASRYGLALSGGLR